MSTLFITFGFISFVMFLYTVYHQGQQIKALKKTVRAQQDRLKLASNLLPRDSDGVKKYVDETWTEIEKILTQDPSKN